MKVLSQLSFKTYNLEGEKKQSPEINCRPQSRLAFRTESEHITMLESLPKPQSRHDKRSSVSCNSEPIIHEDHVLPSLGLEAGTSSSGGWPPISPYPQHVVGPPLLQQQQSFPPPSRAPGYRQQQSLPPPPSAPGYQQYPQGVPHSAPGQHSTYQGSLPYSDAGGDTLPPYEHSQQGHLPPYEAASMVQKVGAGSSEEEEFSKRKSPPDLLQLSNMYESRRLKTGDRSQSSMSDSRLLISSHRPRSVITRPCSDTGLLTQKPRKLQPLNRKPIVPDFRIKIAEQKGLGGLHLSVNYKKKSWKQNAMDPLIQATSEDSGNSETEDNNLTNLTEIDDHSK